MALSLHEVPTGPVTGLPLRQRVAKRDQKGRELSQFHPNQQFNGVASNVAFGAKPEASDLELELPLSADS